MLIVEVDVSDAETSADGEASGREKHIVVVVGPDGVAAPCVTATEEAQAGRAALPMLM